MPEFATWYPVLRSTHIGLALISGGLFAVRGALVQAGQAWAMARPWRMLSYGIDTLLLMAGITLWAGLSLSPIANTWFGVKLLLLLLYIVLGSLALKRARSPVTRCASYASALAVYLFMISVALAHHPLGFFQLWMNHDP